MAKQYKKKSKISEADAFVSKVAKKSAAAVGSRMADLDQAMRAVRSGGDFKQLVGETCQSRIVKLCRRTGLACMALLCPLVKQYSCTGE